MSVKHWPRDVCLLLNAFLRSYYHWWVSNWDILGRLNNKHRPELLNTLFPSINVKAKCCKRGCQTGLTRFKAFMSIVKRLRVKESECWEQTVCRDAQHRKTILLPLWIRQIHNSLLLMYSTVRVINMKQSWALHSSLVSEGQRSCDLLCAHVSQKLLPSHKHISHKCSS